MRAVFGAIVLLSICAISHALPPYNISLASWNLLAFGPSKAGKGEVMDVIYRVLKRYDIAVVQEIRNADNTSFPFLMSQLNHRLTLDGSSKQFGYAIGPREGRTASTEQYGFLWDPTKVTYQFCRRYPQASATLGPFARPPYTCKFRIESFEFCLTNIHTTPGNISEIDKLIDVYDDTVTNFACPNVITLGDMNADCTYVTANEFSQIRFYTDPRFNWLIGNDVDTTTTIGTNCAYDRFVATSAVVQKVIPGTPNAFYFDAAYGLNNTFTLMVSDHYPIELTMRFGNKTDMLSAAMPVRVLSSWSSLWALTIMALVFSVCLV